MAQNDQNKSAQIAADADRLADDNTTLIADPSKTYRLVDHKGMSKFGIRHGGSKKAFELFMYVMFIALTIAVILGCALGSSDLSTEAKSITFGAVCIALILADLAIVFLFYTLRYILRILGIIALCCVVTFALLAGLYNLL